MLNEKEKLEVRQVLRFHDVKSSKILKTIDLIEIKHNINRT